MSRLLHNHEADEADADDTDSKGADCDDSGASGMTLPRRFPQ